MKEKTIKVEDRLQDAEWAKSIKISSNIVLSKCRLFVSGSGLCKASKLRNACPFDGYPDKDGEDFCGQYK